MNKGTIKITSLASNSNNICFLVQIGDCYVLLNIGAFDLNFEYLNKHTESILKCKAVLISHFDLKYTGGLPFLNKINFLGKIYATIPIFYFSRICINEILKDTFLMSKCQNVVYQFEEKDINDIFGAMTQLKYSHPDELEHDIIITAFKSGNTLGGSIWKIEKANKIMYFCLEINHKKEFHLDGMDVDVLKDATVCFFGLSNKTVSIKNEDKLKKLENLYLENEKILFVAKFSKFLEILCILNEISNKMYRKIKVLSNFGSEMVENAKSMVEWAGGNISKNFGEGTDAPFVFNNIIFSNKIDPDDSIFVVFDFDENPFFRIALNHICYDKKNIIVYTGENCTIKNFLKVNLMQNNNQIESNNYLDERNINSENNLIVVEEQKLRINLEIPSIIDITDEEKAILIDKNEAEINRVKEEALLFELLETKDDCVDKEDFMQNKENLKKMFWYEYKTDFFIKNEEDLQYAKFPDSKVLKYDEYGEVFHYAKNLKNEYEISKVKNDMQHTCEEIKFEKIIWENKNLDFNCKEDFVDFDGFCDFNSSINILEKIKPKKLILYGEEKCLIELYHNYLKLSNEIKDVMILNKEIELKIDVKLSKLETTNEFESLINLKKTDHEFIGAAKFSIIEDHGVYALKVLNTGKIGCFGQLKIDEIKNAIVKKGLKVEINNNVIIVEDEIEVSFSQDKSIIMGEAGDLYNFVADVLYKKMAFLNQ